RTRLHARREPAEQQASAFTALGADETRAHASRPLRGLVAVVAHPRWRLITERRSGARIVSIAGKLRGEAYQGNPGAKCATARSTAYSPPVALSLLSLSPIAVNPSSPAHRKP